MLTVTFGHGLRLTENSTAQTATSTIRKRMSINRKPRRPLERSKRLERDVDKVIKDALRAMEERRNPTLGI